MPIRQPAPVRTSFRRVAAVLASALGLALAVAVAVPAAAQDPTNRSECVGMMRAPLEAQCAQLFSDDEQRVACLEQVGPQVQRVCGQFFDSDADFCATCTSSCNTNFPAGDGKRRECLSMCISQPGCG